MKQKKFGESFFSLLNHNDMHPSFWWFADIANSNKYLSDIPWSVSTSTISSDTKHREIVMKSYEYFQKKHGEHLLKIPSLSIDTVQNKLKEIYKNK